MGRTEAKRRQMPGIAVAERWERRIPPERAPTVGGNLHARR
jgi:hypothetical protein